MGDFLHGFGGINGKIILRLKAGLGSSAFGGVWLVLRTVWRLGFLQPLNLFNFFNNIQLNFMML
jgi:hypothetical protein